MSALVSVRVHVGRCSLGQEGSSDEQQGKSSINKNSGGGRARQEPTSEKGGKEHPRGWRLPGSGWLLAGRGIWASQLRLAAHSLSL